MNDTYAMFAGQYDDAIRVGAQASMNAGLGYIGRLVPSIMLLLVPFVALAIVRGGMFLERGATYASRIALFLWLVTSAAYGPMVWVLMAETIPNEIATVVNGGGTRITAIQQFDVIDRQGAALTAAIVDQSGWNPGNVMAAWLARMLQRVLLDLMFAVFISMRWIGYILAAGGVFLLPFMLFDTTRGWVMEFFGKMVGLGVWQVMTAILMNVMLNGMQTFMAAATGSVGLSVSQSIDVSFRIAGWFGICFILLILVPMASAIGSHIGAGSSVVQGAFVGAAGAMGRAAAGAGAGAGSAARRMYNRARRT